MTNLPEGRFLIMPSRGAAIPVVGLVAISLALAATPRAQAQTLTTLYPHQGSFGSLVQDGEGNIYGFATNSILKIAPNGPLTVFYTFCQQSGCPDGQYPNAFVRGSDGNFYGTTWQGGAYDPPYGGGTVFTITPSGTLTTLYSFCSQSGCPDGRSPFWLVQGSDGNFYGATEAGGAYNQGTFFRITPGETLSTLYSFCGGSCYTGQSPEGPLVPGSDGNFYGTTYGSGRQPNPIGGTVFKITPSGTLTVLAGFPQPDKWWDYAGWSAPYWALTQGNDGNFYGIASTARLTNFVFGVGPTGGSFFVMDFDASSTGNLPNAELLQARDGTFYGTTQGGTLNINGAVFTFGGPGVGYIFCSQKGCSDGAVPNGTLVQGSDGNIYGTTLRGGISGTGGMGAVSSFGTVFQLTPSGALTTLYRFNPQGEAGIYPADTLAAGSDGNLYGATTSGGPNGDGTIFRLIPISPIAGISPSGLTFASQDVGITSSPLTVTLNNTGNGPLTISGVAASGDYAQTNNCGSSVPAFSSCTITVTFTPSAAGTEDGNLTITDNSNGTSQSQQIVSLTGAGVIPLASLSATAVSFANQAVGTTSITKKVALLNSAAGTLVLSSIAISGANATDFAQASNCPSSLGWRGRCTISLTFTPSTLATESAMLYVNDNASNSPQIITLTGTGILPVSLMPTSATYSTLRVGTTSSAKAFTLTNHLTTTLNNIAISTTGDFVVTTTTCDASLAARSKCTISVMFTPTATGTRTGTLSVSDAASNSPQVAQLTGTGK